MRQHSCLDLAFRVTLKFVSLLKGEQYAAHEAVIQDILQERKVSSFVVSFVLIFSSTGQEPVNGHRMSLLEVSAEA